MAYQYKVIRPPLAPRFHLPSKDELFKVASGDHVKVMFQVSDDIIERMWVLLQQCGDDVEWTGLLDNDPIGEKNAKALKAGTEVKFHPYDIVDIAPKGSFEKRMLAEEIAEGVRNGMGKKWWENTPVQILMIVSAVAGLVGLVLTLG